MANVTENEIKFYFVIFWSMLHGYIAGCNNTILTYMHDEPLQLKNKILEFAFIHIEQEFGTIKNGTPRPYERLNRI